ncbi:MAG: TolC family protein [Oligoflexia bacterium]|nr:TolC family protein [Oligoflexia bacterium]
MRFLVLTIILYFSNGAWAQNEVPICKAIKSTRDLYGCILQNHPDYKSSQVNHEIASAARAKINQWPNPQVSLKSVAGTRAGENNGSTEVGVTVDLTEWLVKRPALSGLGKSEEKSLKVDAEEKEFKVKLQVIKDLYRLRQLTEELEIATDAMGTFSKIENQFKSRRARGPEQEITLNLVQLAQGDYQLKKNHLTIEKAEIELKYKSVFSDRLELKKEWLPTLKSTWPEVKVTQFSRAPFELRKAEAEKEKAEAEKGIANVDSWPKISAGPVIERNTEGPAQYYNYGFNLNVSLPLFSLNGGAREFAGKNLIKSEYEYNYALKKAPFANQILIQKYESAVEALKKSSDGDSLKKKHNLIDSLFRQGLTSGATIIEAHRQIYDFTTSQHEHEMTALDGYLMINFLSGKDPEEFLK